MEKKQNYKLKCQLSDQKQTPVYFPLYDTDVNVEQASISNSKKEEIVNGFIGADFAFTFLFMIIGGFIFYEANENGNVTNIVNMVHSALLYKVFAGLFVTLLTVPIILWEIYKKSNGISEENYTLLALSFSISSFLFNLGAILIIALFNYDFVKRMNLTKTRIATPIILLVVKTMLIQRWFFK
jgi:hypothetical protein